jgi:hypothetical protein
VTNPPAPSRSPLLPLALAAALFHLLTQFSFATLAEFDAWYHAGMAALYREHGLVRRFPWMAFSILRDRFNDPQLLLHLAMMPFVLVGVDALIAAKLTMALTCAGAFVALYWLLVRMEVRHAPVWALVSLAASPYVVARNTFVKSTPLFFVLLFPFLDALFTHRPRRLFILAWLAVYTYQGFPLLTALTLGWIGCLALAEPPRPSPSPVGAMKGERPPKLPWPLLTPVIAGTACGLVVNPFFPHDLTFFNFEIIEQILMRPKEVVLGAEWGAIASNQLLESLFLPLILLFVAETALGLSRAGSDARLLLLRATTFLLFLGAMMSSRLIDYVVPLALVTAALAVSRALAALADDKRATTLLLGILVFIAVPSSILSLKGGLRLAKGTAQAIHPESYRRAADWLRENSGDGEIVVAQWDDFPMLFFYDRHNRYPFGLSPMYGEGYDAQLYTAHQLLFEGRLRDPESLMPKMSSRFILVTRVDAYAARRVLVDALLKNDHFEEVLRDGELHLFRLK